MLPVRGSGLQVCEFKKTFRRLRLNSFNRSWRFVDSFNLSLNLCTPRLIVESSRLRAFATSRIIADFQSKTDKSDESRSHRKKYVGLHCLEVSHDKAYQSRTNAFSETSWQIKKRLIYPFLQTCKPDPVSTNNCSDARPITVDGPPPDLVVLGPNVSEIREDGTFWLIVTVHNQGDGGAAATTVRYKRSTDGTITTSDTTVGTDAVNTLFPSGNYASDDQADGAVEGWHVLLRRMRGCGAQGVRHH